ncbi:MAG: HipA family kinase [Terriglobia bacterium]
MRARAADGEASAVTFHSPAAGINLEARTTELAAAAREGARQLRQRALELIRPMRGGSQPWLVRCENGGYYVVKFQENPQHVRVLANEMLAGLLAQLIKLPAAEPAFVEMPAALAAQIHIENALAGGAVDVFAASHASCGLSDGLHFGSRFPGDPSQTLAVEFLPDRLLRQVSNLREAFLGALAFDKWTCNCDGRQLVFYRHPSSRREAYTACLIDQGFCFNDGDWGFPDSVARSLYPRRLVYESVRGAESFEPFLSRIENLRRPELDACARQIPPDWCDGEPGGPARLAEMLYMRRRKLSRAFHKCTNVLFIAN